MTPAEENAVILVLNNLQNDVSDFKKANHDSHKRIEEHLAKINGNLGECHNAIFGVTGDDPCILRRLTRVEKGINWLTKNWWWTIIIVTGLLGTGGFAGQVIEGLWKRGTLL